MMKRLNIRLPKELFDSLRRESHRTGLSMSRIVRESLEKILSQEAKFPLKK
jgi:predicted DNA-binding protein